MSAEISKNQIDKLGNHLKKRKIQAVDLKVLDAYRKSFSGIYTHTINKIRTQIHLDPVGRPAKSTLAIIDKLQRESIRLTQMQDIAGCRIVVENMFVQNQTVDSLSQVFPEAVVIDRRSKPSHGYRAVHLIVQSAGKAMEIQVRTELQHLWAELSERLADAMEDTGIKYGQGNKKALDLLRECSEIIQQQEYDEHNIINLEKEIKALKQKMQPVNTLYSKFDRLKARIKIDGRNLKQLISVCIKQISESVE